MSVSQLSILNKKFNPDSLNSPFLTLNYRSKHKFKGKALNKFDGGATKPACLIKTLIQGSGFPRIELIEFY